jgi:hypothetical protein
MTIEIEDLERAVAVTGIEPPAVRDDAVGSREIVVEKDSQVCMLAEGCGGSGRSQRPPSSP